MYQITKYNIEEQIDNLNMSFDSDDFFCVDLITEKKRLDFQCKINKSVDVTKKYSVDEKLFHEVVGSVQNQ